MDKALAAEAREDARPAIVAVAPQLWLGNLAAACDPATLAARGIAQTLNLAVNADVPPLSLPDGTVLRRAKIGLIDGMGNAPEHLAAAVLAISGMLAQAAPGKPSYPDHRPGGLLVHCRGGRSRSVVAVALHLALGEGGDWRGEVARLRVLRGLGPHQPGAAMLALAEAAWLRLKRPCRRDEPSQN